MAGAVERRCRTLTVHPVELALAGRTMTSHAILCKEGLLPCAEFPAEEPFTLEVAAVLKSTAIPAIDNTATAAIVSEIRRALFAFSEEPGWMPSLRRADF